MSTKSPTPRLDPLHILRLLQRQASNPTLQRLQARLRALLSIYNRHRGDVQRVLTFAFVGYCLGSTYLSLTGRGMKGGMREKVGRKGKGGFVSQGSFTTVLCFLCLPFQHWL